jgi:hypothetical protein
VRTKWEMVAIVEWLRRLEVQSARKWYRTQSRLDLALPPAAGPTIFVAGNSSDSGWILFDASLAVIVIDRAERPR